MTSNGVTLQRSNSLTSLASTTTADDSRDGGGNVDYLRICLSCRQILQRRYNHISFKNAEKDEIFLHYEVCDGVCSCTVIVPYRLENCRSTKRTFQRSSHVFGNCGISPVSKTIGYKKTERKNIDVLSCRSGDTQHQIIDCQRLYRRISSCYEKIDTTS